MGNLMSTKCPPQKKTCDGFRETPLRLLGYATHLGNICCKVISPNFAMVPDMITTAYITADIFNKGAASSEAFKPRKRVFIDTFDAVIWQMLATIIIPGLIMNQIKMITYKATQPHPYPCKPPPPLAKSLPVPVLRALPCVVGVLAVPLIRYPVDFVVTKLMDFTYRALLGEEEKKEPPKKEPPKKKPAEKVAPKKVAEKKVAEKKVADKKTQADKSK